MIRDAKPGEKVDIFAFYGDAHGRIVSRSKKSGHIWYLVEIVGPGTSRFEPGDEIEMRAHWLGKRQGYR